MDFELSMRLKKGKYYSGMNKSASTISMRSNPLILLSNAEVPAAVRSSSTIPGKIQTNHGSNKSGKSSEKFSKCICKEKSEIPTGLSIILYLIWHPFAMGQKIIALFCLQKLVVKISLALFIQMLFLEGELIPIAYIDDFKNIFVLLKYFPVPILIKLGSSLMPEGKSRYVSVLSTYVICL